jgi:CheY-like chemotaxis protein
VLRALSGMENLFAGKSVRILLVEDNPVNQKVAIRSLKKLGLEADIASNGLEAISMLERACYDLVLMDVQMPEMDGFDATRHIRANPGLAPNDSVPIIAMTANAMQGDRELCLDSGMNDYLTKPIALRGLVEVLQRWLPSEKGASGSPAGPRIHSFIPHEPLAGGAEGSEEDASR